MNALKTCLVNIFQFFIFFKTKPILCQRQCFLILYYTFDVKEDFD